MDDIVRKKRQWFDAESLDQLKHFWSSVERDGAASVSFSSLSEFTLNPSATSKLIADAVQNTTIHDTTSLKNLKKNDYPPEIPRSRHHADEPEFCKGFLPCSLLEAAELEFEDLVANSPDNTMNQGITLHGVEALDVQFRLHLKEDRKCRRRLMGVSAIDATLVVLGNQFYGSSGAVFHHDEDDCRSHYYDIVSDESTPLKVVSRGTSEGDLREQINLWRMIDHMKIGLVVSTLGSVVDDLERASWSFLDTQLISTGHKSSSIGSRRISVPDDDHSVRFSVLSENPYEFLPASLSSMYRQLNNLSAEEYVGMPMFNDSLDYDDHVRLRATVRLMEVSVRDGIFSPDNSKHKIIHILVSNWHDMRAMIMPLEVEFLKRLASFVNALSKMSARQLTTSESASSSSSSARGGKFVVNAHRQLFHCSAGRGRSIVTLASTLLLEPKVGSLNVDIYDLVSNIKARRIGAMNSVGHYLTLHLIVFNCLPRRQLWTRIWIASMLSSDNSKSKRKMMWELFAALNEAKMCDENWMRFTLKRAIA